MPALLLYLLKVNAALLLFCLCYYTILRPLTFYTLNRFYFIAAILFSTAYPLIDLTSLFARHEKLVKPLQVVVLKINLQATTFARPIAQNNHWQWLLVIFWVGVGLMAIRLIVQLLSLWRIHNRAQPTQLNNQKVRVITGDANPFSFWQSIYINPDCYQNDELQSVIAHEQVHVRQWHTLDILLAELSLVFYWFNPGVWLIKKALTENLEFITDHKILQQGVDVKSYQYSLLYTSLHTSPNTIVNHFNISTIKKRIMMMNSKKSSTVSLTRYGLVAPGVLVLLLAFGTTKAELMKNGLNSAKKLSNKVLAIANPATKLTETEPIADTKAIAPAKLNASTAKLPITTVLDTTPKATGLTFSTDTPKYKANTSMKFTGADSSYYLVDGKPTTAASLKQLNPQDIESMHVVAAPYAQRLFGDIGSKGVVIVTTKNGMNTEAAKLVLKKINEFDFKATNAQVTDVDPNNGTVSGLTITRQLNSGNNTKPSTFSTGTATKTNPGEKRQIKGNATASKSDPFVLIDGKPASIEEMNKMDPAKIERLEVFKDTNGIICITTKESAAKQKKQ
jgi:bla regulator protein BlaR1